MTKPKYKAEVFIENIDGEYVLGIATENNVNIVMADVIDDIISIHKTKKEAIKAKTIYLSKHKTKVPIPRYVVVKR